MDADTENTAPGFFPFLHINPTPDGQDLVGHQFGYRFLPTFTNAVYALVTRVLAVPPVPFPSFFIDEIHWYDNLGHPPLLEDFVIQDYISHLKPHQRKRILQAFENLEFTFSFSSATDCFAKSDELLFKKKARVIWNVPPGFQAVLGPMVRQMTIFLKENIANGNFIFDSSLFADPISSFCDHNRFTLSFACGMVARDLDDWFNNNLTKLLSREIDWAGIFMGDDTFVLYFDVQTNTVKCFESDYSAYDSTQRDAAQTFLRKVYGNWGVPSHILKFFESMASAPLKIKYGRDRQCSFKLKLQTPQTATGKPDTCLGNTILNIHATVHIMTTPLSYADFGFKAKQQYHDNFSHGTFLKGFWCLGRDGHYHWGPLPSASMKLLKSFVKVPSLEAGLKTNLSSIGPVSSPLIRILLSRFTPSIFEKPATDYKIFTQTAPDLCPIALNSFLLYRYGSDSVELFDELESILRVVELGEWLYHPLWKIMADVDYGDGRVDSPLD